GHDAAWRPAASPRGSASSAGQPEAMTPEDRIAARRAEIARRSNEYYQHRARATARQNRRAVRIGLFVCAVVVLAAAAFAAPLILKDQGAGYFGDLFQPAEETRVASLSGSGSVYMSPVPPAREPEAPPDQLARPVAKDATAAASQAAVAAAAAPDVIVPAGEQTAAADPGLLYDEATGQSGGRSGDTVATAATSDEPVADAAPTLPGPEPSAAVPANADTPEQQTSVVAALDPAPAKADVESEPAMPASRTALLTDAEARDLLERGDRLMQLGDIVSARAFYVRALEADRPGAALRLGSTFDPLIYRRMGVQGLKPDATVALEWYLAAAEAGNGDARRAYDALMSHTGQ
ncbi:MAG: hypothetical protein V2I51_15980, partial [Anderseniella sp.]|nr:hypothetical protein [Anderseniella sp.]